jgi:phospholipid/cholesterol/gamma-HCH transport system permease protein
MSGLIQTWRNNRNRVGEQIDSFFEPFSKWTFNFFTDAGQSAIFFWASIRKIFNPPSRFHEMITHMEFIGNKSVLIIAMTGAFTGFALSYQIYLGFKLVNATNLVGPTVALGIARELGPVLTGLIVAARAGGAMAARLGTMRVTEQIDALEVMGIDPKQYLVAPRMVAAIISMPLLCGIFDFVAMAAAHGLCIGFLGLDEAVFWDKIAMWINPGDIFQGLIKSAVFGTIFATVCCNKGFNAAGGAKGVGEATNSGVVNSMVLIIVFNFILTNVIRFTYALMHW